MNLTQAPPDSLYRESSLTKEESHVDLHTGPRIIDRHVGVRTTPRDLGYQVKTMCLGEERAIRMGYPAG